MKEINELKNILRDKISDKDDKILLFKILDKIKETNNNEYVCTNFYNMNEINLIKQYINYKNMYILGGEEYNERNVIVIFNQNIDEINTEEIISSELSYIKIEYEKFFKNADISHRDVLGTILSLGINRELIGDIYLNNNCSYVITKKEISKYLIDNLNKIKNIKVKLKEVEKNDLEFDDCDKKEEKILVSSMRLDNIISSSLNTSRSKIEDLFSQNKVFVNWKIINKKDKIVKIHDVISIRGIGRIIIKESTGISKKGKIILNVEIYR